MLEKNNKRTEGGKKKGRVCVSPIRRMADVLEGLRALKKGNHSHVGGKGYNGIKKRRNTIFGGIRGDAVA